MYVVYKAYDDRTADIIDIGTMEVIWFQERQLAKFADIHDVLGVSVSDGKINYINAYDMMQFTTEDEAIEFCRRLGISTRNMIYAQTYWWVLKKSNEVHHVAYFVKTARERDNVYLAEKRTYTEYVNGAKEFTKNEAYKTAASINKNPKAANRWIVERLVVS